MPQVTIGSPNVVTFGFSTAINLYLKTMLFDTAGFTQYTSGGAELVQGISFQVKDASGVIYTDFNFSSPDIYPPDGETQWEFDWSAFGLPFMLGNTLIITGGIKDQTGVIFYTEPVYKKICKPNSLNESGYVNGTFQIIPDCINNILTVKELTLLVYNKLTPDSVTSDGNLFYPTGAGVTVPFTGTPFSNNLIVNGESRIENETVASYDFGDDIYVLVTYITKGNYKITCSNFMGEVACCLTKNQQVALLNCGNAIGENAKQKTYEILPALAIGLLKQVNGEDSSAEAAFIKKTMNCDCGVDSLVQNQMTPTGIAGSNIVLLPGGATSIGGPVITGSTKTYTITSPNYLVSKEDSNDLAFTITPDTSVTNQVNFKIKFNYDVQSGYILTAIGKNPTLIAQLNALISFSGNVNLEGLDGKCVIDIAANNFLLVQNITGATLVGKLLVDGVSVFEINLFATNPAGIQSALNGSGYGTFTVTLNGNVLSILSLNNSNNLTSINFENPDTNTLFQRTNVSLVTVLQAIIDYLCNLTACQVALCQALSLYYFDYNGDLTSVNFTTAQSQNDYNVGLQNVINNLANRIDELTGITCDKVKAVFADRPLSVLAGAGRAFGLDQDANCTSFTQQQLGISVMQAISAYPDVKALFCALNCEVPGDCPDVVNISLAMSGANIGIYGLTWVTAPSGTQTVTVAYKLNSSSTWLTSTNALQILPNGNISGTTPYLITGVTAGQIYDVRIVNNCGGVGFVKQITTPTGTVYSGSYILDTIIYDICGNSPVTLYSSAPFAIGVIMYNNVGLTVPTTGYNFIAGVDGEIYTMNNATGEILSDTLTNCETGVEAKYVVDNSTGSICTGTISLWTSGAFAIGKVLYTDSALTSPQTGFSYVLNVANNHIYNLNSVTGQVISDTGLTCSAYNGIFALDTSNLTICGASTGLLYSDTAFAPGVTMYTDAGLTTPAVGYNYIKDFFGQIFNINPATAVVGVLDSAC